MCPVFSQGLGSLNTWCESPFDSMSFLSKEDADIAHLAVADSCVGVFFTEERLTQGFLCYHGIGPDCLGKGGSRERAVICHLAKKTEGPINPPPWWLKMFPECLVGRQMELLLSRNICAWLHLLLISPFAFLF